MWHLHKQVPEKFIYNPDVLSFGFNLHKTSVKNTQASYIVKKKFKATEHAVL